MSEPQQPTEQTAAPAPELRRRRRWPRALAALAGGGAVLLLLAPTLATTRPVLSQVERIAAAKLGTPVEIGALRAGWLREVSLESLAVGPKGGRLLEVEGVRVPLSLLDALGGAPFTVSELEVDSIRAAYLVAADGSTNADALLAALAALPGDAQPSPAAEPSGQPVVPLAALRLVVGRIELAYRDESKAPAVDAALVLDGLLLDWPDTAQGVRLSAEGGISALGETIPLSISVDADPALGADRVYRAGNETARVEFALGADGALLAAAMDAKRVGGDAEAELRLRLDLGAVGALGPVRESAPQLEALEGTVSLDGSATLAAGLANAELSLSTSGAAATVGGARHAVPDLSARLSASADTAARRLDTMDVSASLPGVEAGLSARALSFDTASADAKLEARLSVDAGRAYRALAPLAGHAAEPVPAEGRLDASFSMSGDPRAERLAGRAEARWRGGALRLDGLPKGATLAASDFDFAADLSAVPSGKSAAMSATLTGPVLGDWTLKADGAAEPAAWRAELAGGLSLETVVSAASEFLAAPPPATVSGRAKLGLDASQDAAGRIGVRLRASVDDASAAMREPPMRLLETDSLSLALDAAYDPSSGAVDVPAVAFAAPGLRASARGRLDASLRGEFSADTAADLAELYRRAAPLLPPGALESLSGDATLSVAGRALADGSVRAEVTGRLPNGEVVLSGARAVPLRLGGFVVATGDRPEAGVTRIGLSKGALNYGESARADFGADAVITPDGTRLDATAAVSLDHAKALAEAPDWAVALVPGALSLDGTSTLRLKAASVTGAPAELEFGGGTRIPALLFEGATPLAVEGVALEWTGSATVPPGDPKRSRAALDATLGIGLADAGAAVVERFAGEISGRFDGAAAEPGSLSAKASIGRVDASAGTALLSVPGIRAETEVALRSIEPPSVELSATLAAGDGADVFAASLGTEWTAGEASIPASVEAIVSDFAAASSFATLPPGVMPELQGRAEARAELVAELDAKGALSVLRSPVTGALSFAASGVGASSPMLGDLRGIDTTADLSLGGDSLRGSFRFEGERLYPAAAPASFNLATVVGGFSLNGWERLALGVTEARMLSPGLEATGSLELSGLRPLLAEAVFAAAEGRPAQLPEGAKGWLDAVPMQASGTLDLADLGTWGAFLPGGSLAGSAGGGFLLRSRPGNDMRLDGRLALDGVGLAWQRQLEVSGLSGAVRVGKTLSLRESAAPAAQTEAGDLRIARIEYRRGPLRIVAEDTAAAVRGLDGGLYFSGDSRRFMGGSARFDGALRKSRGVPLATLAFEGTDLDARSMVPPPASLLPDALAMNLLGNLRWELRGGAAGADPLDGIDVSLEATRVERRALVELLRALDPAQRNPPIQAGIAALGFGAPNGATFKLVNGLVGLDIRVQPRIGPTVPMTLLRQVPLGELSRVYRLDAMAASVAMLRGGLLALFAETWSELAEALPEEEGP
ncbi:MAG: hypothetical protein SF028_11095 [Candidatus Sumerlaeia bacterium]|nr:hypothetical protein [Candidatus Sumerlaeia bacterium]